MGELRRFGTDTLSRARDDLRANLDAGVTCPCCGQYARRYRRKLNATMCRALIWLVREFERTGGEWVNVGERAPAWLLRTKELATTRHWHLVEQRPNDDDTKRTSGFWRPTDSGIDFAEGRTHVPSHVLLYNNEVDGFSDRTVTIREAIGDRFDYAELMGRR